MGPVWLPNVRKKLGRKAQLFCRLSSKNRPSPRKEPGKINLSFAAAKESGLHFRDCLPKKIPSAARASPPGVPVVIREKVAAKSVKKALRG